MTAKVTIQINDDIPTSYDVNQLIADTVLLTLKAAHYIPQEYPKAVVHPVTGKEVVVADKDEHDTLMAKPEPEPEVAAEVHELTPVPEISKE